MIKVFAKGTKSYFNPDPVDQDGANIYVAYQNATKKDGSDHGPSTIVKYDTKGKVLSTYNIIGHCDGLRVDPSTHLLWALVNNDANPGLYTIDPNSGTITTYTFPTPPHGGGYDDLAFVNGMVFISASNPTLNQQGINIFPAVDTITLPQGGGQVTLTPVLYGNAMATDKVSGQQVQLNEIDPDSLAVDPQGEVVLTNQAGSELVYLTNPGTKQQTVSRLLVGTQIDENAWTTQDEGHFLVVDQTANEIFTITADFTANTPFTVSPHDAGVVNFLGTIDPATGLITPIVVGFADPTGVIFVPDSN
jgi:hypothetical protein